MANSLDRVIDEGELLVLGEHSVKPEFRDIQHRILVATGGFGLAPFTSGRALYARDLFDRTEYRWDAYQPDKDESESLKAQLTALNLHTDENAAVWLYSTGGAAWARDVLNACRIWAEQSLDEPAPSDNPPSLSNR